MDEKSSGEKAIALNKQVNLMIKNLGLEKAILHLQLVNKDKKSTHDDVVIYEYIMSTVLDIFQITLPELFHSSEHFKSTDARMTAYFLISKYVKCSHKQIGVQFGKKRINVTQSLLEFKQRMENKKIHAKYFEKHDKAELCVILFEESLKKK